MAIADQGCLPPHVPLRLDDCISGAGPPVPLAICTRPHVILNKLLGMHVHVGHRGWLKWCAGQVSYRRLLLQRNALVPRISFMKHVIPSWTNGDCTAGRLQRHTLMQQMHACNHFDQQSQSDTEQAAHIPNVVVLAAGLTAAASGCDRLLKTPIPLRCGSSCTFQQMHQSLFHCCLQPLTKAACCTGSYTRHTARSLMMWLLTLPAALWPKMGPSLVVAVFFISYVLIGIDELGMQIEEPFAILPLAPLMMKIRNEVIAAVEELSMQDRQIRLAK